MRATLILVLCLTGIVCPAFSQNKLALLVAIGNYPDTSRELRPIASVTDLRFIKAALQKNGFEPKNVDTLVDAKATKAAILKKLDGLAINAKKDDIIVISFGCHGQQIRDQRTIETGKDEEDGYDEALLPYDARGIFRPGKYWGQNHLRDDELGEKLGIIRKKIGPDGSLLVLLDACHSGTGTRADDFPVSRGEPVPFPDPENPDPPSSIADLQTNEPFFDDKADSLSNMVVFSASGPNQLNKQVIINNEQTGSLSYLFFKTLGELPPQATYGLLFQKIKTGIQTVIPDQTPMMEGNANQVMFSGKYVPKEQKNYIRVGAKELSQGAEDSIFILNLGMVDNMTKGATGNIYVAGKNEMVCKATIRKVENFRSIGSANKLLNRSEAYEFIPDEENYGSLSAVVQFDKNKLKENTEKQLKESLAKYQFIKTASNGDYLVTQDTTNSQKLLLEDRNKKIIWSGLLNDKGLLDTEDINRLPAAVKNSLRIKYLRTLPDGGDLGPQVSAEIIPPGEKSTNGDIVLAPEEIYVLKIHNNTNQKLYYTLIDIYPNDGVEIIYPFRGAPADYSLESNGVLETRFRVNKNSAEGAEFIKIIFSKESMDQLTDVFDQTANRSDLNSFENMMNDLFTNTNSKSGTRADISSIKAEEIGIVTVHFTVKKAN